MGKEKPTPMNGFFEKFRFFLLDSMININSGWIPGVHSSARNVYQNLISTAHLYYGGSWQWDYESGLKDIIQGFISGSNGSAACERSFLFHYLVRTG